MKLTLTLKRSLLALALAVVANGTLGSQQANAGWDEFWFKFRRSFHRSNAWPDPFAEQDARQTMAPFEVMKINGWRLNNTISHELFRSGDGALLASGNERIRWITNNPMAAQQGIYVMQGRSKVETQARLASVRDSLENLHTTSNKPEIYLTNREPGTSSGPWAVKINREWLANLPIPQLPQESASGEESITTASQE